MSKGAFLTSKEHKPPMLHYHFIAITIHFRPLSSNLKRFLTVILKVYENFLKLEPIICFYVKKSQHTSELLFQLSLIIIKNPLFLIFQFIIHFVPILTPSLTICVLLFVCVCTWKSNFIQPRVVTDYVA